MKSIRITLFRRLGFAVVACGMLVAQPLINSARAEDAAPPASAEDTEAKAWDELRTATKPPTKPAEWRDDPACALHAPNPFGTQDAIRVVV